MGAFNRAALSVSFIAVKDSQRFCSITTEVAIDLPAHTADACVRWRMAPEIFDASISPDSRSLPVVRRDKRLPRGQYYSLLLQLVYLEQRTYSQLCCEVVLSHQ